MFLFKEYGNETDLKWFDASSIHGNDLTLTK